MKLEIGKVVENRVGQFTKIINIKGSFVFFCGWHLRKTEAEKRKDANGTAPMNVRAFMRALGEEPEDAVSTTVEAPKLSDAVQKLVDDNGIDATTLVGTGANGAIIVKDVKAAIAERDAMVDFEVTEETLEILNKNLPDGAEALAVGDIVKLDPEHELLKE